MHSACPSPEFEYEPLGHTEHTDSEVCPVKLLKVPSTQGVQTVCPVRFWKEPPGQGRHTPPKKLLNVPMGHSEQVDAPAREKDPGLQTMHEELLTALRLGFAVPGRQSTHVSAPVLSLNEPAPQDKQSEVPCVAVLNVKM